MSRDLHRFMSFAFAGADLLVELDKHRNVSFALGATTGLSALNDIELVGKPWQTVFATEDHGLIAALLDGLKPGSRCGPILVKLALRREDGSARDALMSACSLPTSPDTVSCTLSNPSIAAIPHGAARRNDPMQQFIDEGTFTESAARLAEAARALRKPLEMTFLDMPALQDAEKLFGRAQTEQLVQRIGTLLRASSIDGATAARLGPGRFGLVHDPSNRPDDIAARIVSAARTPDGSSLEITHSSLDIAQQELPQGETLRAIRYVVEQVARDGVSKDKPPTLLSAFENMVESTLERVRSFSRAVRDSHFNLAFQPIASLDTGKLHHFEVLTRFNQEESPLGMIQFAEEIGIIEQLDLAVITRSVETMRNPALDRRVGFAVNVSGNSLGNGVFVNCLLELLDENRPFAKRIAIEVTESARLKNLQEANKVIQEIRKRGFQVGLDDFGAGSASFQYLQALSVDFVKIDGAYVHRLGKSQKDEAMIRGIVRICADLGITTIGEMIETREQADALRRIGVQLGQGWYFGRPSPEPEVPWDFAPSQFTFARA